MSNTSLYNFNPRLREGGDEVDHRLPYFFSISIHASAREATRTWEREPETAENFNPRLREGGDFCMWTWTQTASYFNPRLREGGDKYEA